VNAHVVRQCLFAALFPALILAQAPSITPNGVLNAASYAGPASTGGNVQIAQGSIAVIFGKNLGPAALVSAPPPPLAATLAGTSVKVTSGSTGYDAYPIYTYAGQLSVVIPSAVPVGNATVTVTYNGQTSNGQAISIVKSSFGIITKNSGGSGPAVMQNYYSDGTVKTNGLAAAAVAGQTLILYGTGLGAVSTADNVTPTVASFATNVTINVGGQILTPSYAGRSFYPGLDQINFQLPATVIAGEAGRSGYYPDAASRPDAGTSVSGGCYVPLTIVTGNAPGNQATMSIASGSTPVCNHPMGLSAAAMAQLDNGGTVNVGLALAARIGLGFGLTADGAGAAFFNGTANDVFVASLQAANNNGSTSQHGQTGCYSVNLLAGAPAASATASLSGFNYAQLLDAGSTLSLTGPGPTQTLLALKGGGYGAGGLTPFLANGTWTLSGNGGADVGAFKVSSNVPVVTWTNASQFDGQNVTRGALTINWTGGGPNTILAIAGSSTVIDAINPQNSALAEFICYSPATAQTLTVPASIVQSLPASVTGSTTAGGLGTLSVSAGDASSFTAPLTKGGQLDGGIFGGAMTDVRGVTWK